MSDFIIPALIGGISVFVGLFILWSVLRFATPRQRAGYAAIAGVVSALATLIISAVITGLT